MKKAVQKSLLLMMSLTLSIMTYAQCTEFNWSEDGAKRAKEEESYVLLKDNKTSSPRHAIGGLNWLLANSPKLNKNLYLFGADIYETLAKAEKVEAKRNKYLDSLVILYDLRLQNSPCGQEGSIANYKALTLYPYYINGEEAKELLKLFDNAFKINGDNIMDGTLVPYMQTIMVNKLKYKNPTDEEVIAQYDKITEIITNKAKANPGKASTYKKYQEQIDDIFIKIGIPIECSMIKEKMEPKYRANPDVDYAKKIFSYMLTGKCTDDPLWLEMGEVLIKDAVQKGEKPDFAIAKNVGLRYMAQDKYEKANEMLDIALNIAPSAQDKADILIAQGNSISRKNKPAARELYRKAIAANPGNKEAYERIGDLYMTSFEECAAKESYAQDRLVFNAAYEMYSRAGDSAKMTQAKAQFPSKSEIFDLNWKKGESKKVNCWIGETVTLDTRD